MITFKISTGAIFAGVEVIGSGYSGNGDAINDPTQTNAKGHGSIPVGFYVIGTPFDSPKTGRYAIPLTPDIGNQMWDRSVFECHGGLMVPSERNTSPTIDPTGDRTASDGCIVTAFEVRQVIATHQILQVIA